MIFRKMAPETLQEKGVRSGTAVYSPVDDAHVSEDHQQIVKGNAKRGVRTLCT